MLIKEFLEAIEEELELKKDILEKDTDLKGLAEWDSLAVISLIGIIDDEFGITFESAEFESVNTASDLIEMIGAEKFQS